jgi:hypothetical protein
MMAKERAAEFDKLIKAAKRGIPGSDFPDDLQAAVAYYLTRLERTCRLLDNDDPTMLKSVIEDQIWAGVQFVSMLEAVPPECWEKRVYSKAAQKSAKVRQKGKDEAETYVAKLISGIKLTKSTDVTETARDIRAIWNHPTIRKRGKRWVETRVENAKTRVSKLHLVK